MLHEFREELLGARQLITNLIEHDQMERESVNLLCHAIKKLELALHLLKDRSNWHYSQEQDDYVFGAVSSLCPRAEE